MNNPRPPNAGKGRPLGSVNKHTKLAKRALAQFVADNVPAAQKLFDKVAKSDPKAALELLAVFLRFVVPITSKLQADIEQRHSPVHLDLGISFARGGPGMPRVEHEYIQSNTSDRDGVYTTAPQIINDAPPTAARVIQLQEFKENRHDDT